MQETATKFSTRNKTEWIVFLADISKMEFIKIREKRLTINMSHIKINLDDGIQN